MRSELILAAAGAGVAVGGLVAASAAEADLITLLRSGDLDAGTAAAIGGAAVFVIAGALAVRSAAKAARGTLERRTGDTRGAPVGMVVSALGYVLLTLSTLGLVGVNLEGFLVGGAVTGVVVGIAAQQTLSNLLAGLVLLVTRPFAVGEQVVLRSGPLGGEYEGIVTDIGFFYTELLTAQGRVRLPNSGVLTAAVGPGARSAGEIPDEDGAPPRPKKSRAQVPPKRRSRPS